MLSVLCFVVYTAFGVWLFRDTHATPPEPTWLGWAVQLLVCLGMIAFWPLIVAGATIHAVRHPRR